MADNPLYADRTYAMIYFVCAALYAILGFITAGAMNEGYTIKALVIMIFWPILWLVVIVTILYDMVLDKLRGS